MNSFAISFCSIVLVIVVIEGFKELVAHLVELFEGLGEFLGEGGDLYNGGRYIFEDEFVAVAGVGHFVMWLIYGKVNIFSSY